MEKKRYCFPAKAFLNGAGVLRGAGAFADEVARLQADPATRSLSAIYDAVFLPLKIFFVLIVVAIGLAAGRSGATASTSTTAT